MQLTLDAVRYETLDKNFIGGLKPYSHQAQTLALVEKAIRGRETICILNASMTGSGKTLANFSSAILHGTLSLGVYPTKELIADQERGLREYLSEWDVVRVDSDTLDEWEDKLQVHGHTKALEPIVATWEKRVLLTNPDILYLMMYDLYGYSSRVGYRNRIFQAILNNYPVIAFDEFHLYDTKQVGNVAFIVGAMARLAPNKPHVFIFSSATPRDTREWLSKLNLRVEHVTNIEGQYGRVVAEPIHLTLVPANLAQWEALETIESQVLSDVLEFAKQSTARGVFIIDGVYDAKILSKHLTDLYDETLVGEIHGYMPKDARAGNLEKRFTIGTTTIDVGVDLTGNKAKEFIVLEAKTGDQFIQRIGRLGRQGREPESIQIPNRAWALVPHYVYEFVVGEIKRQGMDLNRPLPRREFLDIVSRAYRQKEDFKWYVWKYSPLEAVAALQRILSGELSDTREETREQLQRVIGALYRNVSHDVIAEDVARIVGGVEKSQRQLWKEFGRVEQKKSWDGKIYQDWYLDDLESFRGSSDLQVALYDTLDEKRGWFPFKIYNLPFVLRRTVFTELREEQFIDLVNKKAGERAKRFLRQVGRARPLGFLRIDELQFGKPNQFCFQMEERELLSGNCECLVRMSGWELESVYSLKRINKELGKQQLNAWIVQRAPWDLMHDYNLPAMFQVYPLRPLASNGQSAIGNKFWSVSFGLNAFLLSTVMRSSQTPYIL